MLKFYQILTIIAAPVIYLYLRKRQKAGKEDRQRFKERLGYASVPRTRNRLAWIHAASTGEAISALPLIDKLSLQYPDLDFLLTTGTVNSATAIAAHLNNRTTHQFVPVDSLFCVKRFLKYWHPDIAIFVESELWPNLITQTSKFCPLIMVNGHISTATFENWKKYGGFIKTILASFSLCLTQSQQDARYITELGATNVRNVGNIKYAAGPLPADNSKIEQLAAMIGNRPVWLAASTHKEAGESEEAIIASVHKQLKSQYPDILSIIVPRHSARSKEIVTELSALDLKIAVRSRNDTINATTDIYLADTMGELGIFYRLTDISFIGGSLVPRGGHNPLEPARLASAIIVGQHTFNFAEIMQEFITKNALLVVHDAAALQAEVASLLADKTKVNKLTSAALEVVADKNGIIDAVIAQIAPYIARKHAA